MAVPARTDLILTFHNHQPVGNFAAVFRAAHDRCYRPLLDALIAHPEVRAALHHSGPVFEWLLREEPGYLDDLRGLVERAQVEVVGGGFYEPMAVMLSDADIRGQLDMMNAFVDRHLGTLPRGLWLAERVWDPDLPRALAPAGVQYSFVDDSHLHGAGVLPPEGLELSGYYVTEKAGATLAVFPISRALRYAIPFQPVEQVLDSLAEAGPRLAAAGRSTLLTYGDDGEKFGLWPGTDAQVFESRWLERLFAGLEARSEQIHTTTPSAVLARQRPSGRVYLPNAAYEEMDAWALPAAAARQLGAARQQAREAAPGEPLALALPFLRGGVWAGFLAKYPESNRLHKRMLQVSARLREAFVAQRAGALYGDPAETADRLATAQRALYAGQCCCAYWHGWFGGIYLPHLRHAVHARLLEAEDLLDGLLLGDAAEARCERADMDGDLADEAMLSNRQVNAFACPSQGGALFAFDDRAHRYPLIDVLARRPEAYHAGLEPAPVYDDGSRLCFVDRFYALDTTPEALRQQPGLDRGSFAQAAYKLVELGLRDDVDGGAEAVLRADGTVRGSGGDTRLRIAKRYLVPGDAAAVQVVYTLTLESGAPLQMLFAPELNFSLLAEDDPQRFLRSGATRLDPAASGALAGAREIELIDAHAGVHVLLDAEAAEAIWHYPVRTLSRGDSGLVDGFQGVAVHPVFRLEMKPGEVRDLELVLGFVPGEEPAG